MACAQHTEGQSAHYFQITDELLIDLPGDVSNPICRVMRLTKNRIALLLNSQGHVKSPEIYCVELTLWTGTFGDKLEVVNSEGLYKLLTDSSDH